MTSSNCKTVTAACFPHSVTRRNSAPHPTPSHRQSVHFTKKQKDSTRYGSERDANDSTLGIIGGSFHKWRKSIRVVGQAALRRSLEFRRFTACPERRIDTGLPDTHRLRGAEAKRRKLSARISKHDGTTRPRCRVATSEGTKRLRPICTVPCGIQQQQPTSSW
jgi:hypothetical protein